MSRVRTLGRDYEGRQRHNSVPMSAQDKVQGE